MGAVARTLSVFGLELVGAGVMASFDAQFLADNAPLLIVGGILFLLLAWFWDKFKIVPRRVGAPETGNAAPAFTAIDGQPRPPDPPPTFEQDWDRMQAREDGTLKIERDKGLSEALAYAVCGLWGKTFAEVVADGMGNPGETARQFRQRAHDGELTVWGRRSQHGIHEKIGADYWVDHQPIYMHLMRDLAMTEPTEQSASRQRYFDLMVSMTEFEEEWPHGRRQQV